MSRTESKSIIGYLPIEEHRHPLIALTTPAYKLLDPFTGESEFLEVAANQ